MRIEQFSWLNVVEILRDVIHGRLHWPLPIRRPSISRLLSHLVWDVIGFLIVLIFAYVACLGVIYSGKLLWTVYTQTFLGQEFIKGFSEENLEIEQFYSLNLFWACIEINLVILVFSIPLAVVCQCLFIKSIFYDSKGFIGKAVFWVIPFSAAIALILQRSYELSWAKLLVISALPSSLIMSYCMELASRIIPDGLVPKTIYRILFEIGQFVLKYLPMRRKEDR